MSGAARISDCLKELVPRGGDGLSRLEVGGQDFPGRGLRWGLVIDPGFHQFQQHPASCRSFGPVGLHHGGKAVVEGGAHAVEAGDREFGGYGDALFAGVVQHAEGHGVGGAEHGGQIGVPLLRRLVLPPFSQRYTSGFHEVGGMLQYTNRGLGFVHLRARFLCRPEITVFTLRSPARR